MTFGAGVLVAPDLFPARPAGAGWGERTLRVELAGESLEVSGLSEEQEATLSRRYGPLCRDARGTDDEGVTFVELFRADPRDFLPAVPGEELRLEVRHRRNEVHLASSDLMGRLELGTSMAGSLWTPAKGDRGFLGAFENFARVVVAYRLLVRGGLLLHSSGVVDGDGHARLFAGRSGAGKTTIARLSRGEGREVLSDDINVVVPTSDGTYVAERLPFAGELVTPPAAPRRFPVGRVYLLRQGEEHRVDRLPAPRAVAGLVACAPFVNTDPHRLDAALRNLEALVGAVPVAVLTFRRDPGFWAVSEHVE